MSLGNDVSISVPNLHCQIHALQSQRGMFLAFKAHQPKYADEEGRLATWVCSKKLHELHWDAGAALRWLNYVKLRDPSWFELRKFCLVVWVCDSAPILQHPRWLLRHSGVWLSEKAGGKPPQEETLLREKRRWRWNISGWKKRRLCSVCLTCQHWQSIRYTFQNYHFVSFSHNNDCSNNSLEKWF